MINLEIPKKFKPLASQANQVATEVFRPISRKYDEAEHSYPKELDMLASLIDGMNEGSDIGGAGAAGVRRESNGDADAGNRNGSNLSTVLGIIELCWGDVGLLLSMPRQGLGNSAIASVASDEQLKQYGGKWAAMAITEPEAGSDSAAIRTTADLDGDEYVLNGEKIFVTSGDRADLIVVWASLDRKVGRAAIRSFIVERDNPGLKLDRLEHKLGIRASDTANFTQAGLRRRDADVRQHAAAGRRDGGRRRPRLARGDAQAARRGRCRDRLRHAGALAVGSRGPLSRNGVRLRGVAAAHPAGGLDGRQRQAELTAGLDGEGEGGAYLRRRGAWLRRAVWVDWVWRE
jgi:alkylation response protein AidB-like acyl-CoA dehydrogenase